MNASAPFWKVLRSHLEGLAAQGILRVPLSRPLTPPPPPPAPARAPLPAPPPRAGGSALPAAPRVNAVIPPPVPAGLCGRLLRRMAACADARSATDTCLLLITREEEWRDEAGKLLEGMLRAIGYEAAGDRFPWTSPPPELPEPPARMLVMGDPALRAVSPVGFDLSTARGLWQSTSIGRMIATYAPSALLQSPQGKRAAWGDLRKLLEDLGLEIPAWTQEQLQKKS